MHYTTWIFWHSCKDTKVVPPLNFCSNMSATTWYINWPLCTGKRIPNGAPYSWICRLYFIFCLQPIINKLFLLYYLSLNAELIKRFLLCLRASLYVILTYFWNLPLQELKQEFSSCLMKIRILAKFLGFLLFKPYYGTETTSQVVVSETLKLRNRVSPLYLLFFVFVLFLSIILVFQLIDSLLCLGL